MKEYFYEMLEQQIKYKIVENLLKIDFNFYLYNFAEIDYRLKELIKNKEIPALETIHDKIKSVAKFIENYANVSEIEIENRLYNILITNDPYLFLFFEKNHHYFYSDIKINLLFYDFKIIIAKNKHDEKIKYYYAFTIDNNDAFITYNHLAKEIFLNKEYKLLNRIRNIEYSNERRLVEKLIKHTFKKYTDEIAYDIASKSIFIKNSKDINIARILNKLYIKINALMMIKNYKFYLASILSNFDVVKKDIDIYDLEKQMRKLKGIIGENINEIKLLLYTDKVFKDNILDQITLSLKQK